MKMFISQVVVAAITGKRKEAVEEQLDRQMGCWRDERMFADQESERFYMLFWDKFPTRAQRRLQLR